VTSRRVALFAGAGAVGLALGAAGCASKRPTASRSDLLAQVRLAEESFAATMARRDAAAFAEFIAEDAVFINGGNPLRGKAALVEYWSKFFAPQAAPFAWRPELVEVASSGTLGYTEGPVLSPTGAVFAKFFTTWQLGPSGKWFVVFDNGYSVCKA
jgi:ketosteroid isomerase-like protein